MEYEEQVEDDVEDTLEELEEQEEEDSSDPLATLYRYHPETQVDYAEKIAPQIPLQSTPPVGDPYHTSQPFLTLYEKTKILGFRANQLAQGAVPYITVPEHVRDTVEIARMELEARRLPFLLKRPMPDGTFEYWRLSDLMVL